MIFDPSMDRNRFRQALGRVHSPRIFAPHRRSSMLPALSNAEPSTRMLGLSVVPFGMQAAGARSGKWGSDEQIAQDLVRLKNGVVTHLGRHDLTWSRLTSSTEAEFTPVAPASAPLPAVASDLYDIVRSSANVSRLAGILRLMAANQQRVVMTALHTEGDPRSNQAVWELHGFAEGIPLPWADEHPTDDTEVAGLSRYRRDVINPSSPYHRAWLADLSVAIASLLRQVQDDLAGDGILLSDVVAGVSLFHFPSMCCVWPGEPYKDTKKWQSGDPVTSATHWAALWWSCASAFHIACRTWGVEVAVRLPAMGTHFEFDLDGIPRRHSLRYRLAFWDRFLNDISAYSLRTWDGLVSRTDIASALSFQWDHKARQDAAFDTAQVPFRLGPRHISHMVADAAAVRSLLDSRGFTATQLDLLQTGTSVLDADDHLPAWADGDREAFQATEVWRRLGGALACGTTRVGLQAWMSDSGPIDLSDAPSREYYGMGLRADAAKPMASARWAIQRPSWFAFQRFASILGTVTSGELLHPDFLPDEVTWEPDEERDLLVIFHYRLAPDSPGGEQDHAYLIVVDPTQDTERTFVVMASWVLSTITGDPGRDRPSWSKEAVLLSTAPVSPSSGRGIGLVMGTGDDLSLPSARVHFPEEEVLLMDGSTAASIMLKAGGVALVRSTDELSLQVVIAPTLTLEAPIREIPEVVGPIVLGLPLPPTGR